MNIHKILLAVAAVCLAAALVLSFSGKYRIAGPLYVGFFLALAIGIRKFPTFKGLSYTVIILAAVTTAMFYPAPFVEINGFKLAVLITPLLQLIMFGMGTSMSFNDFAGVIKMPKGVLHRCYEPLSYYAGYRLFARKAQWISAGNSSGYYSYRMLAQWNGVKCNFVSREGESCIVCYDYCGFNNARSIYHAVADEACSQANLWRSTRWI